MQQARALQQRRGLCRVPQAAGGGGAPSGPAGATGESGQARYFGRAKTRFQLYLAATVANLTLVAGKAGLTGDIGGAATGDRAACADTGSAAAIFGAIRLGQIWLLALLTPAFLPKALFSTKAFHSAFLEPPDRGTRIHQPQRRRAGNRPAEPPGEGHTERDFSADRLGEIQDPGCNRRPDGIDFIDASGTLYFAPGVSERTFTVPVLSDNKVEDTERFFIHIHDQSMRFWTQDEGQGVNGGGRVGRVEGPFGDPWTRCRYHDDTSQLPDPQGSTCPGTQLPRKVS